MHLKLFGYIQVFQIVAFGCIHEFQFVWIQEIACVFLIIFHTESAVMESINILTF